MDAVPTRSRLTPLRALLAVGLMVGVLVVLALLMGRDEPPVIRLAGAGPAGAEAAVVADVARVGPAADIEFELAPDARFAAGEGTVWRLEPPDDLRAGAQALADRFGLGALTPTPEGGFTVDGDPADGSLWVGASGDWSFHRWVGHERADCVMEPVAGDAVEPDVVEPDAVEPAEPGEGEPDEAPRPEPDPERERPAVEPCPEPTPPPHVPDERTARALAEQLYADLDLPLVVDLTDARADEWGAWVSGHVRVAGSPTDLSTWVAFAGDAAITSANGSLARAVEVGTYPTVDADVALERLREQGGWLHAPMPAIDPPAVGEGAGGPDEPVSSPADADDAVTIVPSPEDDVADGSRVVRLVDAEPFLLSHHGADGAVWLLPGVRFTDEDGGTWQAMTVADGYVEFVEPEPEPLPVEPAPEPVDPEPVDPEIQRLAEEVVGLPEAEAIDRLEAAGAVARVVHRDGEDMAVTDDHRTDRVNLYVDGGVVVRAWVG